MKARWRWQCPRGVRQNEQPQYCSYKIVVIEYQYEWDETKNRTNQHKHGLSFEQAVHVFHDPLHRSVQDRVEGHEQRWQTFGVIAGLVVVVVAHTVTEQDGGGTIRLISARRADRRERRWYETEAG